MLRSGSQPNMSNDAFAAPEKPLETAASLPETKATTCAAPTPRLSTGSASSGRARYLGVASCSSVAALSPAAVSSDASDLFYDVVDEQHNNDARWSTQQCCQSTHCSLSDSANSLHRCESETCAPFFSYTNTRSVSESSLVFRGRSTMAEPSSCPSMACSSFSECNGSQSGSTAHRSACVSKVAESLALSNSVVDLFERAGVAETDLQHSLLSTSCISTSAHTPQYSAIMGPFDGFPQNNCYGSKASRRPTAISSQPAANLPNAPCRHRRHDAEARCKSAPSSNMLPVDSAHSPRMMNIETQPQKLSSKEFELDSHQKSPETKNKLSQLNDQPFESKKHFPPSVAAVPNPEHNPTFNDTMVQPHFPSVNAEDNTLVVERCVDQQQDTIPIRNLDTGQVHYLSLNDIQEGNDVASSVQLFLDAFNPNGKRIRLLQQRFEGSTAKRSSDGNDGTEKETEHDTTSDNEDGFENDTATVLSSVPDSSQENRSVFRMPTAQRTLTS